MGCEAKRALIMPQAPARAGLATSSGEATIESGAICNERIDVRIVIAKLAQHLDAVLSQLRRRTEVRAPAAAETVRKPHVDDAAFGRVLDLLEQTHVVEVRVFHQTIERVIRHRRYIACVKNF